MEGEIDYSNASSIEQTVSQASGIVLLSYELFASDRVTIMDDAQFKAEGKKIEKISGKRGEHAKNPVTFDSICKEVMLREKIFRRGWSKKYKHMTGEFFKKVLAEECRKEGLPADTFERKPPEDAIMRSPIPLKPSPFIPRTTSGMVGLRSSRPEYNLEFTGRWYISPKWTIEPPMESDEFRVTQQRFIFLG